MKMKSNNSSSSEKELLFQNRIGKDSRLKKFSNDNVLLSPANAALYLDVSRKFIYEMIASRKIKSMIVGGRLRRIRLSDLESWLTSSTEGV